MTNALKAMEEHCVEHIRRLLRAGLPMVEEALKVSDAEKPAKIAVSIAFKPTEEGDFELVIDGKTSLPMSIDIVKARIDSGQLHLL
ncbi:MAG: hypothetical protein ACE5F1_17335 [Planctomycetota bacterium]